MNTEEIRKAYIDADTLNYLNEDMIVAMKSYARHQEKKCGKWSRTIQLIKAYQHLTGQRLYRVPMKYFRGFLFGKILNRP